MRERTIDPSRSIEYASLGEFLTADTYPAGVLTVMHNGIPIDVWNSPRGHDVTTVFFHAAITSPTTRLPMFTGGGISAAIPTNRVFIADPTLYVGETTKLAWFAGNQHQPDLQSVIVQILRALIPEEQRVVFFGASGGGYAALYYSTFFPGSTAIPVNPQTDIAAYLPAFITRWLTSAWGRDGEDDLSTVPAVTSVVPMYAEPVANRVWYVQNPGDSFHVEGHYGPFMAALDPGNDVQPVLIDGGPGHVPPPKETLTELLAAAASGAIQPPRPNVGVATA